MIPREDHTLARFVLVALGFGLAVQVPALFDARFLGLAAFVMWVPALAVVASGARGRRLARRTMSRPLPWAMMLAASALGWLIKIVSSLLALATGVATLDPAHFVVAGSRVMRADFVWFVHAGEPLALFVPHMFALQLVGVAIAAVFAFGEEIGWRGLLQPELERRFGVFGGTLRTGLVWALFHLGLLLAGHNDGGAHRVLNALVLFPAQLVVVSFLYAWVLRRTGSVWPAVCAHAANNSLPVDTMLSTHSWAGTKACTLVATTLLALVVALLFRAKRAPSARYERLLQDP